MKLSTATNILYERRHEDWIPMSESIKACADAGFRYLDFGFVELFHQSETFRGKHWKKEILEYKSLADSLGLFFVQGHATIYNFCDPSADHTTGKEMMRRSLEGAALLDIPWTVFHPATKVDGGKVSPDTHEINVAFFQEMADYAASLGRGIAIENMWGKTKEGVPPYAISAQELSQLIEDIGRDNVGVCWDAEHGSIENLDQGAEIRKLGNKIKATHISDETGHNNIHILPYTGFADWDDVLRALADIDYQGAFSFEMQHYLRAMPMELVPQAMRLGVSVGKYMVSEFERYRKEKKESLL